MPFNETRWQCPQRGYFWFFTGWFAVQHCNYECAFRNHKIEELALDIVVISIVFFHFLEKDDDTPHGHANKCLSSAPFRQHVPHYVVVKNIHLYLNRCAAVTLNGGRRRADGWMILSHASENTYLSSMFMVFFLFVLQLFICFFLLIFFIEISICFNFIL